MFNFKKLQIIPMASLALMGSVAVSSLAIAETLHIGVSSANITTLDPARAVASEDVALSSLVYNGLVRFPPGSSDPALIEPDLAESWTVSDDGLVWTFKLREGVKFHGNYGEVTAEDVVYSLERVKDPNRSSYASDYTDFEKIESLDPKTVQITLAKPLPAFLGLVANYRSGNIVSKKAAEERGDDFKINPIGSGPFSVEKIVTQQAAFFDAFPDYFRGTPKIDKIQVDFIENGSSRELAFKTGELDIIEGVREQRWVEQAKTWNDAVVDIFTPGEYRTVFINSSREPLNDVRVREAIAAAINVDQIVSFVGEDVGPKGCSVIPTGFMGEDCTWSYQFDQDKARALLKEAGHENGLELTAVVSSITSQLPIMEVIQAQLSEVGINLKLSVVDHPTYHEQIRKNMSDLVFYGAARYPIADSYLRQFYHSNATVGKPTAVANFAHCASADEFIDAGANATNDEDRLKAWSQAQKNIFEEVCSVPLFSLMQVWVHNNKVDYGYDLKGTLNLIPPITENTTITR